MKVIRIIYVFLIVLVIGSCSREEATLSDYRNLVQELKVNSSDYTEEEWQDIVTEYNSLEERIANCKFSSKEKKELNKLRGQCAAYMLKAVYKQAEFQMQDALEQFSDIGEGFQEALGEDGFDGLFNDKDE
jgi:hypothetical protein